MTEPTTIWGLLEGRAGAHPERPFLAFGDRRWSYGEFRDEVTGTAQALHAAGVTPGDRVGIHLPNRPEYLFLMFALSRLGAVMAPLNPALTVRELAYQLDHSGATLAFTTPELAARCAEAGPDVPSVDVGARWRGWRAGGDGAEIPPAPGDGDAVAGILYTSGTTGDPKGAMITQRGYLAGGRGMASLGITGDDVLMTALPLYHLNAQAYSVMGALTAGASLVLEARFSASAWWEQVRARQATIFNAIGAMVAMLLAQPPSPAERDHYVRFVVTTVPPQLWRPFEERFGVTVVSGYSQTESILGCITRPDRPAPVGSVGTPLPGLEVKLVDGDGKAVPVGEAGEALVRPVGEGVIMAGYYRDPVRTAEVMAGGWLRTGDLLRQDADGLYYFVDRVKDIVRRSGENISSAEVEGALLAHPAVAEAAVVAVPDPIRIEEVKAIVRLAAGETPDSTRPQDLIAWCEERLAAFKVPRYLDFRDEEMPKTPTMRVRKFELRTSADPVKGCWDRVAGEWV
ncbi:MAG TPA: AMP-binding protein [Acidimicrobiia bacterium]|nr:AMP-binding protein [Acidimicrobiia bacterium]